MKICVVCIGDRPHAEICVGSFKKAMPSAEIVQLTDNTSKWLDCADSILRTECKPDQMMLFRMGMLSILKDDIMIAIDDDCIINEPFHDALEGDFDVAVVKRTPVKKTRDYRGWYYTTTYPYTTGFVVVKNGEFFRDCYNRLTKMEPKRWKWWGDMASIRDAIDSGKYKVKLLPEERYYQKPLDRGDGAEGSAILWHYSGHRKAWVADHGNNARLLKAR